MIELLAGGVFVVALWPVLLPIMSTFMNPFIARHRARLAAEKAEAERLRLEREEAETRALLADGGAR